MTSRSRITEESVLTRWMGMEIARINDSVVARRRSLADLLAMEDPKAVTRGGGEYHFSQETLATLAGRLPEEIQGTLKLPILFFLDMDIRDSCYLTDGIAVDALIALGDMGEGRKVTGGRLWVARAIAYAIARKYPTASSSPWAEAGFTAARNISLEINPPLSGSGTLPARSRRKRGDPRGQTGDPPPSH
jgi:uncharacterized protein (UPF0216 family)